MIPIVLASCNADLLQPIQSFLATMEEYIREVSRVATVPSEPLLQLTCRPKEASALEDSELPVEEQKPSLGKLISN
ncbi:hypothetical protein QN277_029344 [Acacia crassicarpa]|uniref:Uncharacterized protein n=1 Tax=Acacia crassicarpa TaxID=499986 RepID=A0AAE1J7M3_9FABA|nr:hypothetical protein QN277_029344 [Acacia crassicarpa]